MPKFFNNIDLVKNELQNALVHKLGTAPASPVEGQIYYDTTAHQFGVRNNSTWVYLGSGGGTVTSVDITLPSFLSVTGNPVTTSGTLAVTLASQSAYTALARASGAGVPSFQALDHNWITDFDTQVRTSRLDQMAAPTAAVSLNSQKITNLATPTLTGDAATKGYVDTAVTGLMDLKGATDASANPNYPAASKGDFYVVSVAGKVGGASGKSVDVGDVYFATADNAGGNEATVGTSWAVLEHNLQGALLAANNLSDVAGAGAARANLSAGGYYSSATHSAGTTITVTQATHGLRASRGILVQLQEESSGNVVLADVSVASSGDVTVTFAVSQSSNSIRLTLIG